MREIQVDVAILGAGTAGLTARRAAEKAGASAVLIDPGPLGTTCARVGCMPSKLLIAAAEAAHSASGAHRFGVDASYTVDGRRVMSRVQELRDFFTGFVLESSAELEAKGLLLRGAGRLVDAHTVRVGEEVEVKARAIVLATGSTPTIPPPFASLPRELLMTNEEVFELEDLPESVFVVGAGVIGLELGQALHRLGVRVQIVGRGGQVGVLRDPKLVKLGAALFEEELDVHFDAKELEAEEEDGQVRVRFIGRDGLRHSGRFARVLVAAGRRPNLAALGAVEVPRDARGLPIFDPTTMQLGDTHLFIAGDVNNDRTLLHEAADEGRIAGENAARWPEVHCHPRRAPLAVMFTDPQIAVVGEPFEQMGCDTHRVGAVDFSRQGRARVMGMNRGALRVYGRAGTGELLGAELLGPHMEHLAHLLAWAVQQRMTVGQALEMPFYHPVLEEGLRTALQDLHHNLRMARKPGEPCAEFGPGT